MNTQNINLYPLWSDVANPNDVDNRRTYFVYQWKHVCNNFLSIPVT